jgi:hypothetical protein
MRRTTCKSERGQLGIRGSESSRPHVVDHVGVTVGGSEVSSHSLYSKGTPTPNVRHVVEKLGQRLDRVASDVVELVDKLLGCLLSDGTRRDGRRLVGKEVSIISRGELHAKVCRGALMSTGLERGRVSEALPSRVSHWVKFEYCV